MEKEMKDFNVAEEFGSNVFNDYVMRQRLPKDVYKKLKATIENGEELDPDIAGVVAHEMIHEYDANYGEDHEIAEAEFLTNKKFDSHDTPTFRRFMNMLNNEGIEIRPHTDNLSHEELSYSAMKKAMSLIEEKEFSTSNLPKYSDPNGRWIYNPVDDSYGFPKWY